MGEHVFLSTEKLRDLVVDGVREGIRKELPNAIRRGTEKAFLTKTELMHLTGWSSRQVEYRKKNRSIPFLRRGRTILFPSDEIFEFLEEGRVETKDKH